MGRPIEISSGLPDGLGPQEDTALAFIWAVPWKESTQLIVTAVSVTSRVPAVGGRRSKR